MKLLKLLLLIFVVLNFSLSAKDIKLNENSNNVTITSKSISQFTFVSHLSDIGTMNVKKDVNNFVKLIVSGYGKNAKKGDAELPVFKELLNVPAGSTPIIKILNREEEIISLSDYGIDEFIFPAQPSISKGQNTEDVPFYFNTDYYAYDGFFSNDLVSIELLGKMRGQQLARLLVSPFEYNPTSNQLKVVTKLECQITFDNIDFEGSKINRKKYYSSDFDHLFKSCFNYIPLQDKDLITSYPVKYIIVSDPSFQAALQPLVTWKTKKGFLVVEAYTNDPLVGNTTASIHSFLKDMYDNPSDGIVPTYLLIVGDDAQVPSFDNGNHLSDMYYCEFDGGGDFYPEMYYGRLSATNSGEVETQVNKTLTHEQYTFSDPSFLDELVFVAGVDATFASTHGNPQINYGTDHYFNVSHGLTIHNYLYGSGTPITSDMPQASAAIISDVSAGVGFANYTAHCGSSGWSDPSFETSDISSLQNYDKYGLMIGNCCQSNKFDVAECFGEALLRANNKGAVGYIGGSNNTYWDEDYWWAVGNGTTPPPNNPTYAGTDLGVYDCLMHENGEQVADWFITTGQMLHAGNLAVTQAGGNLVQYYWEIYHIMGDPSLMPYVGVPTLLTASHAAAMPVGISTLTVNTEEHAYVAISMNGVLLDAQLADVSGVVNLTFPAISNIGMADIVITKQFKQPYQGTLQIISPNGPYIIYDSSIIDDVAGNNNSLVDYDELVNMNVNLHNVGSVDATSVNVLISTSDPHVTLVNNSVSIPLINASQVAMIPTPFSFEVDFFVPDQHLVTFDLIISDNLGNTWNSSVDILLNAPVLGHTNFTIDDAVLGNGNGVLDAGETLDLIVDVTNIGHSDIAGLTASLGCLSNYVTINSATSNVTSLAVNTQYSTIFNISINANTPPGTFVEFPFDLTDGSYSYYTAFNQIIGVINEDYETGDFTQYTWIQGIYPWTIDNSNIYEGQNSSRSGLIPDNEESELSIEVDVTAPGDISFYKFLSSEENYDFLKFKINGTKVDEWSGLDNAWSFVSFPVIPGLTTFKWEYEKDGAVEDGQDCAWIDYIVFPPINLGQSTNIDDGTFNFNFFPNPSMGIFNLSYNDNKEHNVRVYDMYGKIIIDLDKQFQNSTINLSDYTSGTYTIMVLPQNITYQIVKY